MLMFGCRSSYRFTSKSGLPESNIKTANIQKYNNYNLNGDEHSIIDEAEKWLGTPYCYGGEDNSCIDCSGYTQQVFLKVGVELPRTAEEQYESTRNVGKSEAKPGDLVFFQDKKHINHVGIYLGNNEFIHSSSSRGVVRQSLNDEYFKVRFAGFHRALNN